MSTSAGSIQVDLGLDAGQFQAGLRQAGVAADKFERQTVTGFTNVSQSVKGAGVAVAGFAKSFVAGLAGGAAFATLTRLPGIVGDVISSVGDLADAAQKAGASAESLPVLRGALEQNGGAAESADKALQAFNVRVGNFANTAGGPAADAIKSLGIAIRDAGGHLKSNDALFREVIDKLAAIPDVSRRAALAAELFGKQAGPDLAGVIAIGTKGLDEQSQRMRDLGQIMSNEAVAAGDRLDDKFAEISRTISTRFKTAVVSAAEGIYDLIDSFRALDQRTSLAGLSDQLGKVQAEMGAIVDTLNTGSGMSGGMSWLREKLGYATAEQEAAKLKARLVELHRQESAILNRIAELNQPTERPAPHNDSLGFSGENAPKPIDFPKGGLDLRPAIAANTDAVDAFNNALRTSEQLATDFTSGFVEDLRNGASFVDSLTKAFGRLADQLVEMALNNAVKGLIGSLFGATAFAKAPLGAARGGVGLGFGALYDVGGFTGAGGKHDVAGLVHKGEFVFSAPAVRKLGVGNLDALHRQMRGFSDGGYVGGAAIPQLEHDARSGKGMGATTVQVINNTGQPSREERSTGPDGRELVKVIIGEVKRDMASGGFDGVQRSRFGVLPRKVRT
jgi:hypothetical protein